MNNNETNPNINVLESSTNTNDNNNDYMLTSKDHTTGAKKKKKKSFWNVFPNTQSTTATFKKSSRMRRTLSHMDVIGQNLEFDPLEEEEDKNLSEEEQQDQVIQAKRSVKQIRLPNPGTSIDDIRKKVDFHQYGKRFILVGLHYECHTFKTLKEMILHVRRELDPNNLHANDDVLSTFAGALSQYQQDPIWIDIQNPSIADMKMLQKYFGLHPLTTEDIINSDTGEKWELFSDYMFVVFTGQVDDEYAPPSSTKYSSQVATETQLNIILFPNYIITIHDRPIKGLDLLMNRIESEFELRIPRDMEQNIPFYKFNKKYSNTRRIGSDNNLIDEKVLSSNEIQNNLEQFSSATDVSSLSKNEFRDETSSEKSSISTPQAEQTDRKHTQIPSSDWILYAFLDAMVDMYIPFVDALSLEVENLDDLVFELNNSEKDDLLKRLGLAKRNVVTLRRLLLPKLKMTTYLSGQNIRFISSPVQIYLRDVLDHLQICLDKLEVSRENLNQTHNNYLTKVQIEIAEASSRTDAFMNRITVLASIIGPLTLISALWGMNVKVPGQDYDSLEWFFGLCTGMIVIALSLVIVLRKKLISR
jgi:Mg2+ and Co2+ transporter CorA